MSAQSKKSQEIDDPFVNETDSSHGTEETGTGSQLFYAYARRTDNYWASRYLLTFASASLCNEWWSLVESEYASKAIRHGPQLFTFQGDNFPSTLANDKKFEHIKTQWFYTQFGDATGTGGRSQEIIPVQDYDGRVMSGGGGAGAGSGQVSGGKRPAKGKGKESADEDDDDEHHGGGGGGFGIDMRALAESLQSTQSMMEMNNAQIAQLTENQARDQDRMERAEKLAEQSQQQLRALTQSNVAAQKQIQELAEQNAKLLKELKRQRTQQPKQESISNTTSSTTETVDTSATCEHSIHPPPRKIDKPLLGYAYPKDKPKGLNAKSALPNGK